MYRVEHEHEREEKVVPKRGEVFLDLNHDTMKKMELVGEFQGL